MKQIARASQKRSYNGKGTFGQRAHTQWATAETLRQAQDDKLELQLKMRCLALDELTTADFADELAVFRRDFGHVSKAGDQLTPLSPLIVALRVPKQHSSISRLPSPLGIS